MTVTIVPLNPRKQLLMNMINRTLMEWFSVGKRYYQRIKTFGKIISIWFKISEKYILIVSNGYVLTFLEQNALVVFPKYFIYRILNSNGNTSILSGMKSDNPESCSRFSRKVHAFPCFTTIQSVIISVLFTVPILSNGLTTIQSS